jgi:transposase-like protein
MSVKGMGFRAIERVKGVHHTPVIYWLKQVGERLSDADDPDIPAIRLLLHAMCN